MIIIHILQIGSDVEIIAEDTNAIVPKPGVAVNRLPPGLFASLADEWTLFYQQSQALKAALPDDAALDQETLGRLRELGATLAATLFRQENPFDTFDFSGPVLFSVDRTLASLPYEALVVSGEFLCERVAVLRQIRSEFGHRARENARAHRDGLLLYNLHHTEEVRRSVEGECDMLRTILDREDAGDWSQLDCTYARPGRIMMELNHARWIHYAGHSSLDALELANGERLEAAAIAKLNLTHVEAVFFNSCWSASQDGEIESLAMAFVRAGVRHLVGFNQQVPSRAAQFIGARFWELLLASSGGDVGQTVTRLRGEIRRQFGDAELSWITLNHFGTGPTIPAHAAADRGAGRRRALTGAAYAFGLPGALGIAAFLFQAGVGNTGSGGSPENHGNQTSLDINNLPPAITAGGNRVTGSAGTPLRRTVPDTQPEALATDSSAPAHEEQPVVPRRTQRPGLAGLLAYHRVGPELGRLAEQFFRTEHPLYSAEERLRLLKEILDSPASDAVKITRLRSEFQ